MSNERTLSYHDKLESSKRAKELKLCRWCGLDVKRFNKRCRTFCCKDCVEQYLLRADTNYVRDKVHERDHGVCAHCGLDTDRWFKEFKQWLRTVPWGYGPEGRAKRFEAIQAYFATSGMDVAEGWIHRRTFWDADHIHPVAEGGGLCGLDNYQTLCCSCHRKKTIAQRKAKTTGTRLSSEQNTNIIKPIPTVMRVPVVLSFGSNGRLSIAPKKF